MNLVPEGIESAHRLLVYLLLSLKDIMIPFQSFLELEDKTCTDILDDARSPGLLQVLNVGNILMRDFVDEEYNAASRPGRLLAQED